MKIEILYPQCCNLFGDLSNIDYLRKCLPQAEFVETSLTDEPLFATEPVDMVYLGPMTERSQRMVLERLLPYRKRMWELIGGDTVFLFTGNALELAGEYIIQEDGSRLNCLEIFPLYAKQDMIHRHNSVFLGNFEGQPVMGFKSQFTTAYPLSENIGLFTVEKGMGLNKKCSFEGIRYRNFFGTYLVGPLLLLNPPFTKSLLKLLGAGNAPLAFEKEVQAAYEKRLDDFRKKV